MKNILIIIGGIFWLLVYVEIIRKGFQDKTYGMPVAALLVNISWEFIYSLVYQASGIQLYINYFWLLLDLIILYQVIKYWRNEFKYISSLMFYLFLIISFATSYSIVLIFPKEFGFVLGSFYTAFGANLMISILFILLFYHRESLRGQSIYIALFKFLGTIAQIGAYYNFTAEVRNSLILKLLYISIFTFDLIYLTIVYLEEKKSLFLQRRFY